MRRKYMSELGPGLLVASGIMVATLIAKLAGESGWLVMAAPLMLALAVVGADVLSRQLRGELPWPSPAALIMAGAFLLAALIVGVDEPNLIQTLIPIIGGAGWVSLMRRPEGRRSICGSV